MLDIVAPTPKQAVQAFITTNSGKTAKVRPAERRVSIYVHTADLLGIRDSRHIHGAVQLDTYIHDCVHIHTHV